MLSLRQKELQGALKLALAAPAALQACTPHPAIRPSPSSLTISTCILYSSSRSLSVCRSTVLHRLPRPLWQCRYAASDFFTASKSSLISVSIFCWFEQHPSCHTRSLVRVYYTAEQCTVNPCFPSSFELIVQWLTISLAKNVTSSWSYTQLSI